jgi:hypothetical protein
MVEEGLDGSQLVILVPITGYQADKATCDS